MNASLFCISTLRLFAAVTLLTLLAVGQNSSAQTFTLTDLGTAGELESHANAINSSNVVAGYSVHATGMSYRAWKWSDTGGRVELGGFGGSESRALAINDAGQIAGFATDASEVAHGFIYDPINGLVDLGTPPIAGGVYPQAINSFGQIAGYITTSSNSISFLWKGPGQWTLQETLPSADEPASASTYALNDSGKLVGTASWLFGGSRGFVTATNGGALTALGTLGGETGTAYGINNAGQVVGEVEGTNGAQRAFILDGDIVHDLGTLGGADSTAFFINDLGDIAGSAMTSSGVDHAFTWSAGTGMEDLQNLIAPTLGWELTEAHGINPNGLIVGNGNFDGAPRAFLLAPRDGQDTNAPVVISKLSTNHFAVASVNSVILTLTVWDDIANEVSTINGSAIRITGPGGYNVNAALVSRTPTTNAIQNVGSFQISPRGGSWDGADNGTYTVSLDPNKIRDIAGNFIPGQVLGTFTVAIQTNAVFAISGPTALPTGDSGAFTFTATGSYPAHWTNVFSFAIDWDGDNLVDETVNGTSPFNIAHSFATMGIYNVRVTATDPHGLSASANRDVVVNPLPGEWSGDVGLGSRSGGAGFYAQGRLYYMGGDPLQPLDGGDSQVDYFDFNTETWLSGQVLDGDRYQMGAGMDNLNRIVAFGHHTQGGLPSTDGFTYTVSGGEGGGIASRGAVQNGFAWCADNLNRLYCIGGGVANVYRYSGSGNSWTTLAPMPVAVTGGAAAYDGQGRIIVVAGSSVFAYNIAGNSWSQLGNAPGSQSGQRAARGTDGNVYFLGDSSVMVFNPLNNSWGVGPVPDDAHDSLVAGTNGLLYAFGGYSGTMEILDPLTAGVPAYFVSSPTSSTGRVDQVWSYQVFAGGNPPPGIYIQSAPAGMTLNAGGLLSWTPGAGQVGTNSVELRVTNSVGIAQQKFTINVGVAQLNNDFTPPSAVSNLVAQSITDTSAQLVWSPTTDNVGVAGYRLYTYVRKSSGFRGIHKYTVNVVVANNLAATTIARSGLKPGYTYTFGVTAFDTAGNESPHTKVTFLTLSPPRIYPGYITAQSLSYAIVGEPWQQNFSVAGNPLPTLSFVNGPSGMTFNNNAVVWNPVQGGAGTNVVSFTLHTANTVTNYDQSFPLTVYPAGTDLVPPSYVTGVQTTEVGADHVGLSWDPATDNYGIAGYWVTATIHYRARYCARGCNRSRLVARQFFPGTNTTAVLGGLEPGTRYYLTIQAVDTAGNRGYVSCGYSSGGYCSTASFTTTPLLNVSLDALPNGNLLFSWTDLQPIYYRVGDYYAYTLVGSQTLATNVAAWTPVQGVTWPVTNTSIEISPSNATNLFYRVKADYIVQP